MKTLAVTEPPTTLVDFFAHIGWRLLIFDLGRRIRRWGRYRFRLFEQIRLPYPSPVRRHAYVGLVLSPNTSPQRASAAEHLLWFIQLPLDERGLLVPASRDYFIRRLLAGFHHRAQQVQSVLEDNPFVFQPNEERLAIFRSRLGRTLSLPPSRYYTDAQNYLQGYLGYAQWPLAPFQGMADVVARWGEDGNEEHLLNALERLPHEPFMSLCSCLENERISARLENTIARYTRQHLLTTPGLPNLLAAGIRGISLGRGWEIKKALIKQILKIPVEEDKDIEILAAISGRAWEVLRDPAMCHQFLLRLAEQNQPRFDAVIADIVFLPTLRQPMLRTLRTGKGFSELLMRRTQAFFLSLTEAGERAV